MHFSFSFGATTSAPTVRIVVVIVVILVLLMLAAGGRFRQVESRMDQRTGNHGDHQGEGRDTGVIILWIPVSIPYLSSIETARRRLDLIVIQAVVMDECIYCTLIDERGVVNAKVESR